MHGRVFWVTGLSGVGKTTIGTRLYYRMKKQYPQLVLLDGDVIKKLFSPVEVDYSTEGRRKRAYQYSELCKLLSSQGITVICCTIAMFDEVRKWNRLHLPNYYEIFIDSDISTVVKRDAKGLYRKFSSGDNAMVGITYKAELPKNPDLIIRNTIGDDIELHVDTILRNATPEIPRNDTDYWNTYYSSGKAPKLPSSFAKFTSNYLKPGRTLIDLGCGNGRDSIFFSELGLKVTAVDSSDAAIALIDKSLPIFAVCDDFVTAKTLFCVDYNYCYARWSIHSINQTQQDDLLKNVHTALKDDGLFFIEARTVNDSKFGYGECLGHNEFYQDNHYRRFVDTCQLQEHLSQEGFEIVYCEESDCFSVMNEDSPTLVRVVAKKHT